MDIVRDPALLRPPERPAIVTVGNFDGVHLGHQALVRKVMERARAVGGLGIAITFDPHPQALLHPERAPIPITSLAERESLLSGLGLDRLVVIPFTTELAVIEAEEFVRVYLLQRIGATEVYVGSNFGFGRGKAGDFELLARMAQELSFHASVVDSVTDAGEMISSTRIRRMLQAGDLAGARVDLGRPYGLWGRVVKGDGRGQTLGFPTANIQGDKPLIVPTGVYAVTVEAPAGTFAGALNHGARPTFPSVSPAVEVHLLDYAGPDLLGRTVRVAFHGRLRPERRFASPDELKTQIARDVEAVREALLQEPHAKQL